MALQTTFMDTKFDEVAKGLAQAVTRRQALKRFGAGLTGMALACFGLANKAGAGWPKPPPPSTQCKICIAQCESTDLSESECKSQCKALGACP